MIDSFTGKHRFLSNFYPSPITYEGLDYPTVEHAYQAAKTVSRLRRQALASLPTPGKAKRAGRRLPLRSGWEEMKLSVMLDLLRLKFEDPHLRRLLLWTDSAELIEGNWWGDRFWGVCRGAGLNHLGRLLMVVREELRAQA